MIEHSAPLGFRSWTTNLGLAPADRNDFAMVVSTRPCTTSTVFTRSLFAGPCVEISRPVAAGRTARGIAVLAKNANVATGDEGLRNALEVRERAARLAGISPDELIIASTGVIGCQYPMETIRTRFDALTPRGSSFDVHATAQAIMTTDTREKISSRKIGKATILGIAKGVGMIEPDMATMLSFIYTDAEVPEQELDDIFRDVVQRTYNSVSIDTDTSTSDTAAIFANGAAGAVNLTEFHQALTEVCTDLVKMIARDGEGASKLIEVTVTGASTEPQARTVAKTIVNSPLVKTMVHGEDPNWGRVVMAIGKCQDERTIDPAKVQVRFGYHIVYPPNSAGVDLISVRKHLAGEEVLVNVDLGIGQEAWTVYGCDLTEGYIRINADYTT